MSYTTKSLLKTNKRNLIMSSAFLVTHSGHAYVVRKVSPKVLENHTGGRLDYFINISNSTHMYIS